MKKTKIDADPIIIKFTDEGVFVHRPGEDEGFVKIESFQGFHVKHFGFVALTEKNGEVAEQVIPTQERMKWAWLMYGQCWVYEVGKYVPWRFSLKGKLLGPSEKEKPEDIRTMYIKEEEEENEIQR